MPLNTSVWSFVKNLASFLCDHLFARNSVRNSSLSEAVDWFCHSSIFWLSSAVSEEISLRW